MSIELQQVKRRITATRQIRQVTAALQRVSSARFLNDRRAAENSRRYTRRLYQIMRDVGVQVPYVDHPLLRTSTGKTSGVILFGSDKGLCGGFNRTLVEAVQKRLAEHPAKQVKLIIVGKVVARRLHRLGLDVFRFFEQPERSARASRIDGITAMASDLFLSRQLAEVNILYMRFITGLKQAPVFERILPVSLPPFRAGDSAVSAFEPDPTAILAALLPEFVSQSIDHAFLNSLASEHAARRAAMSRAAENARGLLSELTMSYRRLRQESITTEMLELSGGSVAEEA